MTRYLDDGLITAAVAASSLEWKLTDPLAFGLTTATPLQRAICRVADGAPLGDLADRDDVKEAIGDVSDLEPGHRPRELCLLSAIRTAKSLMAACGAVHMALTADLAGMRVGETPRIPIVSLQKDLAEVIVGHLSGTLQTSTLLKRFLLEEPNSEGVLLRHPSGTPIEIKVVAGARAGATLVSRWMAGCIFDEFPRMVGGSDAVVNWHDQRDAILLRIRPGCQIWNIGSPWAPYGPAYDLVTKHHGKAQRDLVVIKAPGAPMNPSYWTPAFIAEMKSDPSKATAYKTDCLAEFASPEESLFPSTSIDRATRKTLEIPRIEGQAYFAAMDPATHGNGWTFAIATKNTAGKVSVVCAREWIGSSEDPLDPDVVLEEVADIALAYGITTIYSDQVMGRALVALARQRGLHLIQETHQAAARAKKYLTIRTNLDRGLIDLPPVRNMRTDLLHVKKVPSEAGGVTVRLPKTSDGRHCDWAPTLMLVLSRLLPDADPPPEGPFVPGEDPETKRLRAEILAKFQQPKEVW